MAPSGTWWSTLEPGACDVRYLHLYIEVETLDRVGDKLTFLRMEAREEYGLNHDSTRLTLQRIASAKEKSLWTMLSPESPGKPYLSTQEKGDYARQ